MASYVHTVETVSLACIVAHMARGATIVRERHFPMAPTFVLSYPDLGPGVRREPGRWSVTEGQAAHLVTRGYVRHAVHPRYGFDLVTYCLNSAGLRAMQRGGEFHHGSDVRPQTRRRA